MEAHGTDAEGVGTLDFLRQARARARVLRVVRRRHTQHVRRVRDDVLGTDLALRERRAKALDALGAHGDLLVVELRLRSEDLQRAHPASRRASGGHVNAAGIDRVGAEYHHGAKGYSTGGTALRAQAAIWR